MEYGIVFIPPGFQDLELVKRIRLHTFVYKWELRRSHAGKRIMKRIIALLFFMAAFIPLYGQKLLYKDDNEQEYSVGVSPMVINQSFSISLCYYKNKTTGLDGWLFRFVVPDNHHSFSFDRGSLLLMRTKSDAILEFTEEREYKDVIRSEKRLSTANILYFAAPDYWVSEESLNTIITDGVKKIRFDSTGGYIDFELTNNAFSEALKKQKEIIIEESCFIRGF